MLSHPPQAPSLAAAGALSQRSRRRIADVLAGSPDGLGVAEIAEAVGLHHTAVRQHLRRLADAGVVLVVRDEARGRGRPRLRYRLVDMQSPRLGAHQELSRMLVTLLGRAGARSDAVSEFGREYADRFEVNGDVVQTFGRMGFAPREDGTRADAAEGRLALRLEHCPFAEAVAAPGGEIVCHLHRGLTDGIARRARPGAHVQEWAPEDPVRAGCRVVIGGLAAEA